MVVTERDANREVTLASGATLVVSLRVQGGTGYGWEITHNDPSRLKPSGPPQLEVSDKVRPGAAQQQIFRFTAAKTGTTRLALHYVRPWEQEKTPAKTFSIEVRIQ